MKRISVTTLETYRKFLYGTSDFATEESVINAVKGIFTGREEYVSIGTAFHEIVEKGMDTVVKDGDLFKVQVKNNIVTFNEKQVKIALAYKDKFSPATHEMPLSKVYTTEHMDILVEARCDMIFGMYVRDIKTKYSKIDYFDYADSAQWKFYLELTGLNTFYFDMFEFKGYKPDKQGFDVSEIELIPAYSIECIRYDKMERDNQGLVEDFVSFCKTRDLIQYLKETKD